MHKRLGNFAFVQKRAPPNGNFAFVYKRAFVHKRAAPPPAGDHGPEITIAGNRGRKITEVFVHKRLGNQGVPKCKSAFGDPPITKAFVHKRGGVQMVISRLCTNAKLPFGDGPKW